MILDGRKMQFASRKRLNQQKKAETQFRPTMPIHLPKKQTVGWHRILAQIIEKNERPDTGVTVCTGHMGDTFSL